MTSPGRGSGLDASVVAVDIGGTTVKGAAVSGDGTVVRRLVVPTGGGGDTGLTRVTGLVDDLVTDLRDEGAVVQGIGLASPGRVDRDSGVISSATNLRWRDVPLADRFQERYGVPVQVEHDARAGALAEHELHAGGGWSDFAFVPIGTGVSAALVVHGTVVRGATGSASEFGHLVAVRGGERCTCGQLGCVEAYASSSSILRRYHRGGGRARSTPELLGTLDRDPVAREIWAQAVSALATGLASLVTMFDPEAIVLGGGLSRAGSVLLDAVRRRLDAELVWRAAPRLALSPAEAHSALLGAVLLARDAGGLAAEFSLPHVAEQLRVRAAPKQDVALRSVS